MLIMTLFNKDQLTGLKLEMNEFVNKNIVSMITMAIDSLETFVGGADCRREQFANKVFCWFG